MIPKIGIMMLPRDETITFNLKPTSECKLLLFELVACLRTEYQAAIYFWLNEGEYRY